MRTRRVVTSWRWGDETQVDESAVGSHCCPLIGHIVATLVSDWSLSIVCVLWASYVRWPDSGRGLAPGMRLLAAQSPRVESGPVFHLFPAFSRVSAPLYAAGEERTDTAYRPSRDQINSAISSPLTRVLCAMMSSDNKPQGPGIQPPSLSCTDCILSDWYVSLRVGILYPHKCAQ